MTYADVNRQLALIFNVLLSIICCGAAIWIAAQHWDVPARLAVSMIGAVTVGVAEVVIYMGYLRRLTEAKTKEKKKVEIKTVEESWVIQAKGSHHNRIGERSTIDPHGPLRLRSGKGADSQVG